MTFRPRLGMATLFSLIIIGLFALGSWIMDKSDAQPEPLEWRATYEERLWAPLRDGNLTLADVEGVMGQRGELWMISADGEPQLISRHVMHSDGADWRLQAVISLDERRMDSLKTAQDWKADMVDQSVSPAVGAALVGQAVERMSLTPFKPIETPRIIATLGEPDMRLEVSGDDQAWVYGRAGIVVAVTGEQAYSIMFGLRGNH
ncbi:hypothetical protein [Halopseudomonas pelagia]|uniref:hypothetical protein n=1 Tax=Halopseudomonas pelagia TaxID=553151 RepID=UPI00039D9EC3|nr:hypothetical protein [Halopseudomonas pelagia]